MKNPFPLQVACGHSVYCCNKHPNAASRAVVAHADQPSLQSEFQNSQGYTENLALKNKRESSIYAQCNIFNIEYLVACHRNNVVTEL